MITMPSSIDRICQWGEGRSEARESGGRTPGDGRFLQCFNKNNTFYAYIGLKGELRELEFLKR